MKKIFTKEVISFALAAFIIWGRYRKRFFRYCLTISFQFHHTQMDGAHAGKFLANLQNEINRLA